ncbi:uncharacterized protein LOC135586162 isoform X1 [Musa acuminata AAA Group]|uniref:uncharacterized protein LOC135586162 isoform X1 n=1 Tax=Musa acuminata AAA Group TaxID=214697 RepID=UPI0031D33DBA
MKCTYTFLLNFRISRRSKDHLGIWVAISIHLTTPLPCFPLFSPTVIVLYNIWTRLYQVVLVSATFPKEILELTNKFMADPIRVLVKRDELMLEGINQFFVAVEHDKWKFGTLCDLHDNLTITQAVIFCSKKRKLVAINFAPK